jgi:SAM-dependent methyltransferase
LDEEPEGDTKMEIAHRILEVQVPWAQIDPSEFVYVPCNLCCSYRYNILGALHINWQEFSLVQCNHCDLIWRTPLPGRTFNQTLYSEDYFKAETYHDEIRYQVGISDSSDKDKDFRDRISRKVVETWVSFGISPIDENGNPRKLLEIGGGRGYLQRAAGEFGWNTIGLEISPHAIKAAISRGHVAIPVTLDELCRRYVPYKGFFNLVVFFDFLEHVDDPGQVLRMIKYVLSDDGVIIFRVPNTSDRPNFHLIDHIWHFSLKTIGILLWKEGFAVKVAYDGGTFKVPEKGAIQNIIIIATKTQPMLEPGPKAIDLQPNPLKKWLGEQKYKIGG